MVVTLHVACKMLSPLEICFSAQRLCFVAEYRELCVANESLPHEKYFRSHDWHTLPVISLENFDFLSGLCLNQGFEIFEVLKDLRFFLERVNPCKTWEIINKNEKKPRFLWYMDAEKDPWGHCGSDPRVQKLTETFLCRISLEGVFREHIPHILPSRNGLTFRYAWYPLL